MRSVVENQVSNEHGSGQDTANQMAEEAMLQLRLPAAKLKLPLRCGRRGIGKSTMSGMPACLSLGAPHP
jgi:hypothetical protein